MDVRKRLGILAAGIILVGAVVMLARSTRVAGPDRAQPSDETDSRRTIRRGRISESRTWSDSAPTSSPSPPKPASAPETVTLADRQSSQPADEQQAADVDSDTRERLRYEEAQRNAYKFRETDPEKVVPTKLKPALEEAAKKHRAPLELLMAMMYAESGGAHRDARHSIDGGYGVMNLRENNLVDTLNEAAQLLGVSKEELIYDQRLNIEGAAAVLARYHDDALAAGVNDAEAWYMAVCQYSGRPQPELAAALADETAAAMIRGFEMDRTDGGGSLVLPPNPRPMFLPRNWKAVGLEPPSQSQTPPTPVEGQQTPGNPTPVPTPAPNAVP